MYKCSAQGCPCKERAKVSTYILECPYMVLLSGTVPQRPQLSPWSISAGSLRADKPEPCPEPSLAAAAFHCCFYRFPKAPWICVCRRSRALPKAFKLGRTAAITTPSFLQGPCMLRSQSPARSFHLQLPPSAAASAPGLVSPLVSQAPPRTEWRQCPPLTA